MDRPKAVVASRQAMAEHRLEGISHQTAFGRVQAGQPCLTDSFSLAGACAGCRCRRAQISGKRIEARSSVAATSVGSVAEAIGTSWFTDTVRCNEVANHGSALASRFRSQ